MSVTTETLFRRILICDLVTLVIIIVLAASSSMEETPPLTILDNILICAFLIYVVNLGLLYSFKPIGRLLYLPLILVTYGSTFFMPLEKLYIPSSQFESLILSVYPLINGMIIAMLFFTELSEKFTKKVI